MEVHRRQFNLTQHFTYLFISLLSFRQEKQPLSDGRARSGKFKSGDCLHYIYLNFLTIVCKKDMPLMIAIDFACTFTQLSQGKTAIAEGLAQIIAANTMLAKMDEIFDRDDDGELVQKEKVQRVRELAKLCPPRLRGHRVVSLELANLVAGTKYRGEFEERLQSIVEEVTDEKSPPTILFIDEIHTLVGAGSAEGGIDAANMLKPALARGKLQVIGATTIAEYRKHIEKDAALERRLQPLLVKEPTVSQTVGILEAIADKYGAHHGVQYTPESIAAAAKLSERYINDRFLPDKVSSVNAKKPVDFFCQSISSYTPALFHFLTPPSH